MAHWRSTPGHGYLVLSPIENQQVPEQFRQSEYEEDCDWATAVLAVPSILYTAAFKDAKDLDEVQRSAMKTCRNWNPDAYEVITGEKATPENSYKRAEAQFYQDHQQDWVVTSACGDWHKGVPQGMVLLTAKFGGVRRHDVPSRKYMIPAEKYEIGRFGYVIQPDDHQLTESEIAQCN